jgi:hypothetical protein
MTTERSTNCPDCLAFFEAHGGYPSTCATCGRHVPTTHTVGVEPSNLTVLGYGVTGKTYMYHNNAGEAVYLWGYQRQSED